MRGRHPPRICVTLAFPTIDEARRGAMAAISEKADLLELRLDYLSSLPTPGEMGWCAGIDVPLILTLRKESDGGRYKGPERERLEFLEGLAGVSEFIDLEFRSATRENISRLQGKGSKVIISHHDFSSTPPRDELLSILFRAKELGGDVYKIATKVQSTADLLALLSLPQAITPAVVIPMGKKGRVGRLLAPLFGSEFAYACLDGYPAIAPGMLTIGTMRRLYDQIQDATE